MSDIIFAVVLLIFVAAMAPFLYSLKRFVEIASQERMKRLRKDKEIEGEHEKLRDVMSIQKEDAEGEDE